MNGLTPISLNDFEGTPPLPLEVDDEYLTTTGHAPQPTNTASYMSGFVAGLRLFQVLGQCQLRQRILHACPEAGTSKDDLYRWIEDAQHRVRSLLEALPEELQADIRIRRDSGGGGGGGDATHGGGQTAGQRMDQHVKLAGGRMAESGSGGDGHERETTFGIQQANIHITALCLEFALVSVQVSTERRRGTEMCSSTSRSTCDPRKIQSRNGRAWLGKRIMSYRGRSDLTATAGRQADLASIPIEYLASNGESMVSTLMSDRLILR